MRVVCLYLFGYNYKKRPFVFCYGYITFPGPIDAWISCKSGHGRLKDVAANPPCPLLLVMVAERLFQGRIGLFGHVAVVQPVKQSRRELFDQHGGAPLKSMASVRLRRTTPRAMRRATSAALIIFSSLRGDSP